jgi:hypothetical protein
MTLLEVLVACGILMLGLTGIAGLLAAATSFLGEASDLDRVGTLLANASAEIQDRQICRLESFQAGVGMPGIRTACIGEMEPRISPIASVVSSAATTSAPLMRPSGFVASRIDVPSTGISRGFVSEDRLQWRTGTAGLTVAGLRDSAVQDSQRRACWGGLLTLVDFMETPIPYAAPASAPHPPSAASPNRFRGLTARLDTVIFKKPADDANAASAVLLLTATAGAFTLSAGTSDVQSSPVSSAVELQKTFLGGCSYVLALPPAWADVPSVLPPSPAVEGLAVLDRADGLRVDPQRYPTGLKLAAKYIDNQRQRTFFLVGTDAGAARLSPSAVASIFGSSRILSDGLAGRTKTVGAYTIRLLTRQDMQTVMKPAPGGWPSDKPYLSSTGDSTGATWAYDLSSQAFQPSAPSQEYYVPLEVALSPTWYRIQSSWRNNNTPNLVTVIFTDFRVGEFPRVGGSPGKLRIAAFAGLLGVESTFLMVE